MNKPLQTLGSYLRRDTTVTRLGRGQGKFQSLTGYISGLQQQHIRRSGLSPAQQQQEALRWRNIAWNDARRLAWDEYREQQSWVTYEHAGAPVVEETHPEPHSSDDED